MLKVVSFTICPFVQRITALLEAKGLDYQVEYISLSEKPQWFLDISPNGQVPLLITEQGTALFESDAIAEYLEEAYPALQADLSAEQKALNRAWSYLGTKQYLLQCSAQSSQDIATLRERSAKLAGAFAKVEKVLGNQRFFNSEQLSMVDIAWLPVLHRAEIIRQRSGYEFLAGFPKVKAWQQALLATGLAEQSVAEDFEQAFSRYYLSDKTQLGRCRCAQPSQCQCHSEILDHCCIEQCCIEQAECCNEATKVERKESCC